MTRVARLDSEARMSEMHHGPLRVGIGGPVGSGKTAVRTENLIRFDLMTESLSVGRDDRADYPPLEPGRLALQAQELA
jgi:pantothenate kinase-related protein Tda10